MFIEDWIASLVSALLSFFGVSSVTEGSVISVPVLDHSFVVTLSCVDLVGICLWSSIFVFVVWVYVNLNGINLSRRKYVLFSILGFAFFFFANIFRMFLEIYYVSTVGASYISYFAQWQAFEEQVGIGIMFATFSVLILGFHVISRRQKLHGVCLNKDGIQRKV